MEAAEKASKKAIEICPLCGSEMEKGYIASHVIAWSSEKLLSRIKGLFGGEMIVSRGYPYCIVNVEARRCRKCKLVVFQYGEIIK